MKTKIHASSLVKCWVEDKIIPIAFANDHHVRPKEAGGDDSKENRKYLCAGCHQNLHRLADLILAKNEGKAKDLASIGYKDPAQIQKILWLAGEAARWIKEHDEDVPQAAREKAFKTISYDLSSEDYNKLMTLALESGYKSAPKITKRIIQAELQRRFLRSKDNDDDEFEEYKKQ